jgi:antitoxin (DNA-binding transcriptional repressor) of toxin-antitoxin stability system
MVAISIKQLHEQTDHWVRQATELEPVVLTENGRAVAKILAVTAIAAANPFLTRKLLPGFAELQARLAGGTDSADILSEMRDGR